MPPLQRLRSCDAQRVLQKLGALVIDEWRPSAAGYVESKVTSSRASKRGGVWDGISLSQVAVTSLSMGSGRYIEGGDLAPLDCGGGIDAPQWRLVGAGRWCAAVLGQELCATTARRLDFRSRKPIHFNLVRFDFRMSSGGKRTRAVTVIARSATDAHRVPQLRGVGWHGQGFSAI